MPIALPPVSPWGEKVLPPSWELSVWQKTTRDDEMVNKGRDDPLPKEADVVIIGSGLAGTATAYNLLSSPDRPKSVVVLEAREACSGASGRNAGHCRPDSYRGFNAYSKQHGEEEAKKILQSEQITLENVDAFVKKYDIDCEWTPRETIDVCLTDEFAEYAGKAYEDSEKAGIDLSKVTRKEGEEAKKSSRSPLAKRSFHWGAASLNPAKLCYGVHRVNYSLGGYSLFTYTPVTSVVENEYGDRPWKVKTTRGSINATKVVYATNGYTKHVLPEFDGLITSFQAQAVKLTRPPDGLDEFPRIEPTMSLRYELHRFYSVAQRPDNTIVLASPRMWPGQTAAEKDALYDTWDDSTGGNTDRAKNTFEQFCKILPGGGYDASNEELVSGVGGYDSHWTGILGFTPDSVPFVGPIPGKEGQYMIAGFNGHGMARIFHVAPCLASVMIDGDSAWDSTVPRAFKLTPERLDGLKAKITQQGHKGASDRAEATALLT